MTKPERIRSRAAAAITGLPLRSLQGMAARSSIPGAAKLGACWTFNEAKLRQWILEKEDEVTRRIIYTAEAPYTGDVYRVAGMSIDEACERAIGLKPKHSRR